LLGAWCEVGGDPDAFWHQTPRLFRIYVEAKVRAAENDHKGRAWLAYHTAILGRMQKPPKDFARFLAGVTKPKKQTPEQLEAALRSFFGPPPEETPGE